MDLSSIAIDFEASKSLHFCHDEFSDMSLHELLHFKDGTKFQDQVVMCIDQQGNYNKAPSRPILDPFLVDRMVYFRRNSSRGQIYRLKRLQASLHFSTSEQVAEEISFRVHNIVGGHKSIPDTLSIHHSLNCNFASNDIFVHNKDSEDTFPKAHDDAKKPEINSDIIDTVSVDSDLFSSRSDEDSDIDQKEKEVITPGNSIARPIPPRISITGPIPKKKTGSSDPLPSQPLKETRRHLLKALQLGLLEHMEFSEKKGAGPSHHL